MYWILIREYINKEKRKYVRKGRDFPAKDGNGSGSYDLEKQDVLKKEETEKLNGAREFY